MFRIIFLVLFFIASILFLPAQETKKSMLSNFNRLLGKWERENTRPGETAFEEWEIKNDTSLTGIGVTLKGKDTSFVERLSLVARDKHVFYGAEVSHNAGVVYFRVTEISDNGFICENPEHDFPKKIEYTFEQPDKMTAIISGDGKEIPFNFRRVE